MRGHRHLVHSRAVRLVVHPADPRREPDDDRRQYEDDGRGDEKPPERRRPPRARGGSPGRTWKVLIAEGMDDPRWYDRHALTELVTSQRTFDERIARARRRSGSSGSATPDCRWRWPSPRPGFDVTGIDLNEDRVARSRRAAPTWSTCRPSATGGVDGRLQATADYSAVAELDALTICVPTPLSKTRTPDLSYIVSAAESVAAHLRPGQLVDPAVHDLPGDDGGGRPADPRARRRRASGRTSSSATPPSGSIRATSTKRSRTRRSWSAGVTDECRGRTELLYGRSWTRSCRARPDGRRDREAAREHLPRGQHRAGERAGADVRPARHLRLGGHRGRGDQAVRLPAPLPGPRARRGLHPDRAALPGLAAARVRLLRAADRGRA